MFKYFFVFLLIFLYLFSFKVSADTTTATYVGTANDIGGGSFSWDNLDNIVGNNSQNFTFSTITTRNDYSNKLLLKNFDLAGAGLPKNAKINGIQIEVERNVSNTRMRDTTVQLTKNGTTLIGENYGNNSAGPLGKQTTIYGGFDDLWGENWTTTDLLSSNFGVVLQYRYRRRGSGKINLYNVKIIIDYTPITQNFSGNILDFESEGGYNVVEGIWERTQNDFYEGNYGIKSGNKNNNSQSCFEVVKNIETDGEISFFKKVSSEENYDFLKFYINGEEKGEWSGEDNWSKQIYNIKSGINTFKWCYEKDNSVSNGQDGAFIDFIFFKTNPKPGGISSGLQFWLKSDKGTSTNNDGESLTTWYDQSGNGFDAKAGNAPIYYKTTHNLNFYPLIDFDGERQYLQNLDNGGYSHSYYLVIVPDNDVDGKLSGQFPFGFNCESGDLNVGSCGLSFAGLTLGAFTIAINDEVITHSIGSSSSRRSSQIGNFFYPKNKPILIGINENSGIDGNDIFEKGLKVNNFNSDYYQNLSGADYSIGRSPDYRYRFYYDGKIAEIINFSKRLNNLEKNKLESYLSLKYGITLNSGQNDYIASDGETKIWSKEKSGDYINNIFGIGRDDKTQLGQIKSKSVNNDGIITIEAIGEGNNILSNFSDMGDLEFLTISHNNGGNNWIVENSPLEYNILDRNWLVQEKGDVGDLSLEFDFGNLNFDIGEPNLGEKYYFVYDTNNDGSFGDENPQIMENIGENKWKISGINLSDLTKFTIAIKSGENNIPTNILISNNEILENNLAGTKIGDFSTTDLDSQDIHTYSLVSGEGDFDNSYFYILGKSLYINESSDYELKNTYKIRIETNDGKNGFFQKEFFIYVKNIGEEINSIIDFETPGKYVITSGEWLRTTNNPKEGNYSIESKNNGENNSQSCFEIKNSFSGTGTITFDYNVSTQSGRDELKFYIDNLLIKTWSGDIAWSKYENNLISSGKHNYKWCYVKDGSGSSGEDKIFIDYITFGEKSQDSNPPLISGINYSSGSILPGGNHKIIINYKDEESGINIGSGLIKMYKWNGNNWGEDISSSGIKIEENIINEKNSTYFTNNLSFGKYLFDFEIFDNSGNSSQISFVFYIDNPEIKVNTGFLDLGNLAYQKLDFSGKEIIVTVKTIGAPFELYLLKDSDFSANSGDIIIDWDGEKGVGYDFFPYSGINKNIKNNSLLKNQQKNININGNLNTYTYKINIGTLIKNMKSAGEYRFNLSFSLVLKY